MRIKAIEMEGVAEMQSRFTVLGTTMATEICDEALGESAKLMAQAWIRVAPYGDAPKTKSWTLRSGEVRRRNYGHGRDHIKAQRAKSPSKNRLVWRVSTNDAFWLFIYEHGKFDQPPRPTFRPATEAMRDNCIDLQTRITHERVAQAWANRPVNAKGRNV